MDYRRNAHSVYGLKYHFVFVTEGRKKYIKGDMANYLKDDFNRLIEKIDGKMLDIYIEEDHVHIIAELSPKLSLQDVIGVLKGCTSRNVKKEFRNEIEKMTENKKLPFWHSSYLVSTGELQPDTILGYIEEQGQPKRPKGRPPKKAAEKENEMKK